ncbi:GTP 3',8-cyclase MoaA [Radiobacillus kanasensis]|nr:GTP 3',8-cyclase MoaA [Radiobacillus kanasensis]UFU01410.1 GTP 3',8-cyclase MoaA [Radiobacillus kanasensis]
MILDQFSRQLQDLRISVTDRCNFRCSYCMPKEIFGRDYNFMPKEQLLSFEEIERLAYLFVKMGVKKIRITGGEPLLRTNVVDLIRRLHAIDGLKDIGLTTNGVHLNKFAEPLLKAGLRRVNVSLDALDEELFKSINDSGVPPSFIIKGMKKAKDLGMEVKVNMVVRKGMNDQEILPMAKYFKELGITLRFIEFMDVGSTNGWNYEQVVTKKEIHQLLSRHFELEPVDPSYVGEVAKRYRYKGTETEVGYITSVSESFCSSCTRARIAADGKFYTCLFANTGFDLRELVRSDLTDIQLEEKVRAIWTGRDDRYSDIRTEETAKNRKRIEMSYIGG